MTFLKDNGWAVAAVLLCIVMAFYVGFSTTDTDSPVPTPTPTVSPTPSPCPEHGCCAPQCTIGG